MCAATERATLTEGYVSDELFDRWTLAADAVVLPYREIWSSGVLERARLHGTPVIAADLPQLADQVPPGSSLFSGLDQLVDAMHRMVLEQVPTSDLDHGTGFDENADHENAGPLPTDGRAGSDVSSSSRPGWTVDAGRPDRRSVQTQVELRARAARLVHEGAIGRDETVEASALQSGVVDELLDLGALHRPQARSARPGVGRAKRLVQRLVDWRIEPVAVRVEELQRATLHAVAELERRQRSAPARSAPTQVAPIQAPPIQTTDSDSILQES